MAAEEDTVDVMDTSTIGATIGTQQPAGVPDVEDKSESSILEARDSTATTCTIEGKGKEGAASEELIEPTLDPIAAARVEGEEHHEVASDVQAEPTVFIPAEVAAEANDISDSGEVSEVDKAQNSIATTSESVETTEPTVIMPSAMQVVASGVEDYAATEADRSINAPNVVDAVNATSEEPTSSDGVTKASSSSMPQASVDTIEAKHVEEVTVPEDVLTEEAAPEEDLTEEAAQEEVSPEEAEQEEVTTEEAKQEEVTTEEAEQEEVTTEEAEQEEVTTEEAAQEDISTEEAAQEEDFMTEETEQEEVSAEEAAEEEVSPVEATQEEAAQEVAAPQVAEPEEAQPEEQVELMTISSEEIASNLVDAETNSSMVSGRAEESQGSAATTNTAEAKHQADIQSEANARRKGKGKVVFDSESNEEPPSIDTAGSNACATTVESDEGSWDEELGESQVSHVAEPRVTWKVSATTIDLSWGHSTHTFPPGTIFQIETKLGTAKAWTMVYYGSADSYQLAALPPASKVGVRIRILNTVAWTFETTFTTESGPPSQPSKPVALKHGIDSIELAWRPPVHDGGRCIEEYCVEMYIQSGPDNFKRRTVSTTHDSVFVAKELEPGTNYVFCVYAHNELGDSPRSVSVVTTDSAPPAVPKVPVVENSTSKSISLSWPSPRCNGKPVSTFVLEMLDLGYGEKSLPQETVAAPVSEVYRGTEKEFVVKKLQPLSTYAFRVQAINAIGSSEFSGFSVCKTSTAAPSTPPQPRVIETKSSSAKLIWMAPERDNGAPVFKYTLEMQEVGVPTPSEPQKLGKKKVVVKQEPVVSSSPTRAWIVVYDGQELGSEITGLSSGREYRFRVKAQNAHGSSSPSSVSVANLLATAPGTPPPPTFDKVSPTTVQIKWTAPQFDNGMPVSRYALHLDDGRGGPLRKVYEGEAKLHNLSNLIRASKYRAAVQAINARGASELSEVAVVELPVFEAPPLPPAAIDVEGLPRESKAPEKVAVPAESKAPEKVAVPAESKAPEKVAVPAESKAPEKVAVPAESKAPEKVAVPAARPKLAALEVPEVEKPAPQSPPKRAHLPPVVEVPKTLKNVRVKVESSKAPTPPSTKPESTGETSAPKKLAEASPPKKEKTKPAKPESKGEFLAPKKLAVASPPEQEKPKPAKLPIVAPKPEIVPVQKKEKPAAAKPSGSASKRQKPVAPTTVVAPAAPKATSPTRAPLEIAVATPKSASSVRSASAAESIKSKKEVKLLVKKAHQSWLEKAVDFVTTTWHFKQFWPVWIVFISVVAFFSFRFFHDFFYSAR